MSSTTMPFNEESMPVGAGPFRLVDYWDHIPGQSLFDLKESALLGRTGVS